MVSVARCDRVSYKTHDGRETSVEEDIELANKLVVSTPLHASPAEHQALPDMYDEYDLMLSQHSAGSKDQSLPDFSDKLAWKPKWKNPQLHGNLTGWKQYRKMLPNEFVAG